MPLTSRANKHPTASRLTDFGAGEPFLPSLLLHRKNPTSETTSKNVTTPTRNKGTSPRREKRHAFLRRKQKTEEAPLLSDHDAEMLNLSRSFGSIKSAGPDSKRVMDLALVPEVKREYEGKQQRLSMPSYIESPPRSATRKSDRSYSTAITASSSGSASSGDLDHSLMMVSPPSSPNANHRVIVSHTGSPLLPFVHEDHDDVKVVESDSWANFFGRFDSNDQHKKQDADEKSTSTSSGSSASPYLASPTDAFIKLVEDCEARWNVYTESIREWTFMPVLSRASDGDDSLSTEKDREKEETSSIDSPVRPVRLTDYPEWTATEDVAIIPSPSRQEKGEHELVPKENEIIRAQQEEIEYLRAQLLRQQELLIREEAAFSSFRPNTWEQIDTIPMEEIEVTIEGDESLSIESAITNVNESMKFNDDASYMLARIPPSRPDAASVVDNDAVVPSKWVKNFPVKLQAANGYVRNARYSGPSVGGVLTGVATLNFETGDEYMGEVVNGKASMIQALVVPRSLLVEY